MCPVVFSLQQRICVVVRLDVSFHTMLGTESEEVGAHVIQFMRADRHLWIVQ